MFFQVPDVIKQFSQIFNENGHKLFIVGGAVRDKMLNIDNDDYDFTTDATPEQIMKMFKRVIPTGIKHGTVTVIFKNNSFEVTTFRTESGYSDKRHPDNVNFSKDLSEDLSRRDFTVNALAADCENGIIIDLFNGKEDLEKKTVRAIGKPSERFEEDALRLMRLCRFCAKLGFSPDSETLQAAVKLNSNIVFVSQERVFEELKKTLLAKDAFTGLKLMEETGLLKNILPEVDFLKNIKQNKEAADNALEHTFLAVKESAERNYPFEVRFALLLHDIGKTSCSKLGEDGRIHFPLHDSIGAQQSIKIMKRLKCSNQMIDTVSTLISNHMVKYDSNWTDGAVKRFINRVGEENIDNLFKLQWCDQIASEGYSKEKEYTEFETRITNLKNHPLKIEDLNINGNLLAQNGIPKNKNMGLILNMLLELVIDNPDLNNENELLKKAIEINSKLN